MLPFKFIDNPYFNAPILRPVLTNKGSNLFELTEAWIVKVDDDSWLEIPAGTLTNYASVPWFLRGFISQTDPAVAVPSIIHDYLVEEFMFNTPMLYKFGADGNVVSAGIFEGLSAPSASLAADKLFKKYILSFAGRTTMVKAILCYSAIRLNRFIIGH